MVRDVTRPAGDPRRAGRGGTGSAWTGAITPASAGRRRPALIGLPLLTRCWSPPSTHLNFADDLLVFLLAVVTVTVVGGFWPAVLAAAAASLLLNWFLTPPAAHVHHREPRNLLALVLFVTVAVAVSSVVHLAARRPCRPREPARRPRPCSTWPAPCWAARTPRRAVLDHLTGTLGGRAELQERTAGRWIRVAVSGGADTGTPRAPRARASSPGRAWPC